VLRGAWEGLTRGAWEGLTRDAVAIFGIRGEVAAVPCISRIPRDCWLRCGGDDDDSCVGALVGNGGVAGVVIPIINVPATRAGNAARRTPSFGDL
jgi:hypothetical protein